MVIERRETLIEELITIRDYIRWAVSRFHAAKVYFGHGTDNAWDEATQLILHTIHLPWDVKPELLDARLTHEERKQVLHVIDVRIKDRVPAAYITSEGWFAGLKFYVDERVLVPRSPIGELIENQFEPWLPTEPAKILDLCTGSGCIGIACAYAFPYASVDLSDISFDALEVAKRNISEHQLGERVNAIESDLFSGLKGNRYDLIVSNPPYVDAQDLASMPAEYHAEPDIALASGDDGLDFTRRFLSQASEYLSDNGCVIIEVGNSWVALEAAFPQVPFMWIEFERGGHGVFCLTAQQLKEYASVFAVDG